MAVDFVIKRAPGFRVATRILKGTWPGDKAMKKEFAKVSAWARTHDLMTGYWFFRDLDGPETPIKKRRWEVGIQIRSSKPARGEKGLSWKFFPPTTVVAVRFSPDAVSPSLVYYGLGGWFWWQKKEKKFRMAGPMREVYSGNPWKSKRAWANTEIQAPVKRLSR
ncbi:MAG: GyrI-like domain-containing protein [Nitrososphaerales archaeon]|nr:GyrI-like domain-containing protein [Nitrososphaerales archaeon]